MKHFAPARRTACCAITFFALGLTAPHFANAESIVETGAPPDWATAAIKHAQRMRVYADPKVAKQSVPASVPQADTETDATGQVETLQPNGATTTSTNAFFQSLGTNGRTCASCHDPQSGWTVSPTNIQARFQATQGSDPLFRLVDGATCSSDTVSTPAAMQTAYALLLNKGLLRIALPVPTTHQFAVTAVSDPYNCTTNSTTGLTNPTTGIVSVYRRPLPSTNLRFLATIMWDGREPSLTSQAIDATLIHAQASFAPTTAQQTQIVGFESDLYTAQSFDDVAQALNGSAAAASPPRGGAAKPPPSPPPAQGGPAALVQQPFTVGENTPASGTPANPIVFSLYTPWQGIAGNNAEAQARASIARGEKIFNTKPFPIAGNVGLPGPLPAGAASPPARGTCSTCHNATNVGSRSDNAFMNTGVTAAKPPTLNVSGLPVFTLTCQSGPLAGRAFSVTDPGRALISGNCADIGATKVPELRGLAARTHYFHNGSAAGLIDVVNFYDAQFHIGFTAQEKTDLVNFMLAL